MVTPNITISIEGNKAYFFITNAGATYIRNNATIALAGRAFFCSQLADDAGERKNELNHLANQWPGAKIVENS